MRKIIGICGETGSGKTTIIDFLCKNYHLDKLVETTDRPKRENETHEQYKFVSCKEFLDMICDDMLVGVSMFKVKHEQKTFKYGFNISEIPQNGVYILQCNWQSLPRLEKYFKDEFVSIQIVRDDKQKMLSVLNRQNVNVYEACNRFCRDKKLYSELETDYIVYNDNKIDVVCKNIYNDIILRS